jgi:hypothetical protein
MQKITMNDIRDIHDYEKIRSDYRKKIIDIKKNRRIALGNRMSILFENRETLIYQIQEMARIERMVDEEKIKAEIEVYNKLVPEENELSATLFFEILDPITVKAALNSLKGIEDGCISLKIGNKYSVFADFDQRQIDFEGLSAVQYLRFKFTSAQKELFIYGDDIVFITVNHPNYQFYKVISDETKASLYNDFLV